MQLPWSQRNPFAAADRKAAGMETQQPKPKQENELTVDNTDPNKKKTTQQTVDGDDPIANLESLWQPNMDKDGKEIVDESDNDTYMPVMDQKKLQAMVDKMDFTSGISKEEIDALKAGGEDAVGAMLMMVNRAGRKSFSTAFQASSKLAEQGFSRAQDRFMKKISPQVRDMMVESGLGDNIAITKNPMFKPLVKSVKDQFLKKFPKATPDQVTQGVKQYFEKMEAEFAAGKKSKDTQVDDPSKRLRQGDPNADFEAWLGDEIKGMGPGMFQSNENEEDQQQL